MAQTLVILDPIKEGGKNARFFKMKTFGVFGNCECVEERPLAYDDGILTGNCVLTLGPCNPTPAFGGV